MTATLWLILSSLLYSLQLSTGSYPKPLTEEEEKHYPAPNSRWRIIGLVLLAQYHKKSKYAAMPH